MTRRQLWRTGGVTLTLALLATPALSQTGNAQTGNPQTGNPQAGKPQTTSAQRAAQATSALEQADDPVSLQSLPWVSAPARPRPAPKPHPVTPSAAPASDAPSAAAPASPSPASPSLESLAPAAQPSSSPQVLAEPVQQWTVGDAQSLVHVIAGIEAEGLFPDDYQPEALQRAITNGPGPALDEAASRAFDWLAEDLRDGRTPMTAREDWFVVDPDQDQLPTASLMAQALGTHDIAGVLGGLDPTATDFATLKAALASAPPGDDTRRAALRLNMDRWRWLPRDLGRFHLMVNVPEFEVRFMVNGRANRAYRAIVGKPGRTETPQLSAKVQSIVFYPTWTVPQSIIEHDHLAQKIAARPTWAAREGYTVKTLGDGSISIVQQPGPLNSLGDMKIDMPNPHAIYLHDTNARYLFARKTRAFSHGCVRTENAAVLGMTMAILSKSVTQDRALEIYKAKKNTRVPINGSFPVYIAYFTMGTDITGQLTSFDDLYNHDAAVLASFAAPREAHTTQRTSDQEVIVAPDPL
jgi:murein L,D-transpeptidase YcbB/YkuD